MAWQARWAQVLTGTLLLQVGQIWDMATALIDQIWDRDTALIDQIWDRATALIDQIRDRAHILDQIWDKAIDQRWDTALILFQILGKATAEEIIIMQLKGLQRITTLGHLPRCLHLLLCRGMMTLDGTGAENWV